jgi:hypothetical protein
MQVYPNGVEMSHLEILLDRMLKELKGPGLVEQENVHTEP